VYYFVCQLFFYSITCKKKKNFLAPANAYFCDIRVLCFIIVKVAKNFLHPANHPFALQILLFADWYHALQGALQGALHANGF
jgi:hypothetical protein